MEQLVIPITEDRAASMKAWDTRGRGKKKDEKKQKSKGGIQYPKGVPRERADVHFEGLLEQMEFSKKTVIENPNDEHIKNFQFALEDHTKRVEAFVNGTYDYNPNTKTFIEFDKKTRPENITFIKKQLDKLPGTVSVTDVNLISGNSKVDSGYNGYWTDDYLVAYNSDQKHRQGRKEETFEGVVSHELAHGIYENMGKERQKEWQAVAQDNQALLENISYYINDISDDPEWRSLNLVREEAFCELRRIQQTDKKGYAKIKKRHENSIFGTDLIDTFEAICGDVGGC